MTIETKFDKGEMAFFIDDESIVSFPVSGIYYDNGIISYSFTTLRALTNLDKDKVVRRNESKCFKSVNELAETSEIDDSDIATKFDILPEAQIDSFKETESESASEYLEEETISDPEILPEIQIESSKQSGSSAKAKKSDLSAEAASERVSEVQDENVKEPEKPVKKIDFEITNPDDLDIDDKGQIGLF
jgi:topoisomerase-4 subunit A